MRDPFSEATRPRGALRATSEAETRACPLYQAQTVARRIAPAPTEVAARTDSRRASATPAAPHVSEPAPTVELASPVLESTQKPRHAPDVIAPQPSRRSRALRRIATCVGVVLLMTLAWLAGANHAASRVGRPAATATPRLATATERPPPPGAASREPAAQPAPPSTAPAPPTEPFAVAGVAPRAAAEQLAANRYRDALARYRDLARANPNQRAYAHVAQVLERRLRRHCEQRAERGDPQCEGPH